MPKKAPIQLRERPTDKLTGQPTDRSTDRQYQFLNCVDAQKIRFNLSR